MTDGLMLTHKLLAESYTITLMLYHGLLDLLATQQLSKTSGWMMLLAQEENQEYTIAHIYHTDNTIVTLILSV